jgi:cytochrome c biogenesis protein CcmG/thiol:disulfide interchange protein DsbE
LGVTGAPETFLVDQNGIIRVHHLGDVNERVWRNKFLPVMNELKGTSDNKPNEFAGKVEEDSASE